MLLTHAEVAIIMIAFSKIMNHCKRSNFTAHQCLLCNNPQYTKIRSKGNCYSFTLSSTSIPFLASYHKYSECVTHTRIKQNTRFERRLLPQQLYIENIEGRQTSQSGNILHKCYKISGNETQGCMHRFGKQKQRPSESENLRTGQKEDN